MNNLEKNKYIILYCDKLTKYIEYEFYKIYNDLNLKIINFLSHTENKNINYSNFIQIYNDVYIEEYL
jgi:hypothetical protein